MVQWTLLLSSRYVLGLLVCFNPCFMGLTFKWEDKSGKHLGKRQVVIGPCREIHGVLLLETYGKSLEITVIGCLYPFPY